jgi:hypothetical protein
MPYYKYEPQSIIGNSNYNLYYRRSIITDRTIHNNRPDIIILDNTIKEAYLIDVALPNSHNLHSIITEKLQKYTGLKEELIRIWQLKTAYMIPLVLSTTGTIPNKLRENLKPLNLRPALYILMHKAVILNTCRIVRTFLAQQWIRSACSVRPYCCENRLYCCEVRNMDDSNSNNNSLCLIVALGRPYRRHACWVLRGFVCDII